MLNLPSQRLSRPQSPDFVGGTLLFVLIALGLLRIAVVGTLPVLEILMVPLLIFLVASRDVGIARNPLAGAVLLAGFVWLVSQGVSNWMNETTQFDNVRGLANIAMFLITLTFWCVMLHTVHRALLFIGLGLCAGTVLQIGLQPDIYQQEDPWKFGVGHAVTLALALVVGHSRLRARAYALPIFVALAAAHFALGSRTLAGVTLLTAATVAVVGAVPMARRANLPMLAMMAVGALVAVAALRVGYEWAIKSGLAPEEMRVKFESQSSSNLGFILSGRSELLVSTQAIAERPWMGYGSWARDERFANELVLARLASGQTMLTARVEDDFIPSHSHLFGAWVQGGIIGAAFWFGVLALLAFRIWQLAPLATPEGIGIAYLLYSLAWDVPFSPLSLGTRTWSALGIAVLVSSYVWRLRRRPTCRHAPGHMSTRVIG
jgi:O-antigen ligase